MRSFVALLFLALYGLLVSAGECEKHAEGDAFCGNNLVVLKCSNNELKLEKKCDEATEACQDKQKSDDSPQRNGAQCSPNA